MDLQTELNAYVTAKTAPYAAIKNAAFPGESTEEIVLRLDPSEAVESRYLDGTIAGAQIFSLIARSKVQATARNYLEAARLALDLSAMQQLTGALFGKIEAVSVPVFVSKSDGGIYEFSASFEIEYFTTK